MARNATTYRAARRNAKRSKTALELRKRRLVPVDHKGFASGFVISRKAMLAHLEFMATD